MSDNPDKREAALKKAQLIIAVLAGLTTLVVGVYNIKSILFKKEEPVKVAAPPPPPTPTYQSEKIREAVEEVGASWIKKLANKD